MWIERPPLWPPEALGLLRLKRCAGGDHQHVVMHLDTVGEMNRVVDEIDALDLCETKIDAAAKLLVARPDDLLGLGEPERDEQQAGLVHVAVVAVDDRDARLIAVLPLQPVRDQRPSGAPAENDDPVDPSHHPSWSAIRRPPRWTCRSLAAEILRQPRACGQGRRATAATHTRAPTSVRSARRAGCAAPSAADTRRGGPSAAAAPGAAAGGSARRRAARRRRG